MRRRAVILIGVLVVVTLATLSASLAMHASRAVTSAVRTGERLSTVRADGMHAVRAIGAMLGEQRDDLLRGGRAQLREEFELYERDGVRVMVRLVPISGRMVTAESAKLDVNHATVEMLSALEGLDEAIAQRIVDARDERPILDPWDLLAIEGITEVMLLGSLEEIGSGTESDGSMMVGQGVAAGLLDRVTVFSADPNVMIGLSEETEAHAGSRRINLNAAWSDEMRAPIAERWGEDVANAVQQILGSGVTFPSDSRLVRFLTSNFGWDGDQVAGVLDGFTTSPEPYLFGRVDLNTVDAAVLACLPGFDADTAERAVSMREGLDDERRLTVTWLVDEEILTGLQFIESVDHLTVRCLQWRVRFEVFSVDVGEELVESEGFAPPPSEEMEETRGRGVVLEVVYDLAAPRLRIAQVIDVTHLALSASMLLAQNDESERERMPEGRVVGRAIPGGPSMPEVGERGVGGEEPMEAPVVEPAEMLESVGERASEAVRPFSTDEDSRLGRWNTARARRSDER